MAYSHDSDRTNTPSEHEHIPSQGQSALEHASKLAHILDNSSNNSSRDRSLAAARSESPQAGMQAYHRSAREPNGSPAINNRPKSSLSNDGSGRRASPDASQAGGQTAQRQAGDVPPGLRYSHSEAIYERSGHSDEGKAGYALWLPWEESALIDWLYEPSNRRLFNEPRRKKDCHERIIRDVLPSKTSRAIEGKIRTLEKRYQRAEAETHRPDFSTKHQGNTSATMPIPVVSAPQPTTAPLGGSMRQAARDDEAPPAPREEIEWLQLNLRREELAFRKQALEQERVLEAQRVRLEERRLEMQAREADLESQRLLVQQKQMDVQVETLKGLTSMLHQTVASLHDVLRDLARPSQ
ncbi:hypothetical protein DL89DRAFT_60827 [Linderina pennispora]|uniref:Uncharacterized protein n=1 Tax=Linderina pennispora TaxID=61395 RepID=A0A1Y1W003_9FUNG|nr:uncharacterized protein DL89DRAFT_60827 [Linderina pennispora]ORX66850.1 hypothetical protein DL89DRAFT_60827 [Linderina pennispora]